MCGSLCSRKVTFHCGEPPRRRAFWNAGPSRAARPPPALSQQPRVSRFLPRGGGRGAPAAQAHTPGVMLLLIKSRMEKIKAKHFFFLFYPPTPPPSPFLIPHKGGTTRLFLILKLHCSLLQRSLEASPDCLVEIWLVLDCHFNLATSESCFPVACQLNWCVTDECTAHRWCLSVQWLSEVDMDLVRRKITFFLQTEQMSLGMFSVSR